MGLVLLEFFSDFVFRRVFIIGFRGVVGDSIEVVECAFTMVLLLPAAVPSEYESDFVWITLTGERRTSDGGCDLEAGEDTKLESLLACDIELCTFDEREGNDGAAIDAIG